MKRHALFILFGLILLMTVSTAHATDYVFACKNMWMQLIDVVVTADSENQARRILKTQKPYSSDYSLCSYRGITTAKKKPAPLVEETPEAAH
jgi:hypothetical protein